MPRIPDLKSAQSAKSMIIPDQIPSAQQVGRHYDDLDAFYRDIWGEHVHHGVWTTGRETPEQAVERLIEIVADAARIQPGDSVCDVGCGYGGTAHYFVRHRHAKVTGFTVSAAQHRYAVERAGRDGNPTYRLCRWEDNSLPPNSIDAVVSIECLTHIPDKGLFFREIRRVLRPGGCAVLTVWMTHPRPSRGQVRHLLEPICREGRLAGIGSEEEYRQFIVDSGLTVERFEDWTRRVRKTWRVCVRRLLGRLLTSRRYWTALFDRHNGNRIFAVTLFRILLASHIGAMRYGFLVLRKPEDQLGRAETV